MNTLEEKILQYGLLSPEEQLTLSLEVDSQPHYVPLLADVKALYELIARASQDNPDQVDERLAYLAAQNMMGISSRPSASSADTVALQHLLASDAEIAQRYDEIRSQMAELVERHDPVAQFEALSGHKIAPNRRVQREDRGPYRGLRAVVREPRTQAKVFTGVTLFAVMLFMVLSVNQITRLGYLTTSDLEAIHPSQLRSMILSDGMERTQEDLERYEGYLNAFSGLTDRYARAQQRWFFIHYIYDVNELSEVEAKLEDLADAIDMPPELLVEVRFLLAKAYLAVEKTEEAHGQLLKVQRHAGFKSHIASRLLEKL